MFYVNNSFVNNSWIILVPFSRYTSVPTFYNQFRTLDQLLYSIITEDTAIPLKSPSYILQIDSFNSFQNILPHHKLDMEPYYPS